MKLAGDIAATPTVSLGTVYVPDYGGKLWALSAWNGATQWSRPISDYSGLTGDVSRTSPATAGFNIIFGDGTAQTQPGDGAHVMAANRFTGAPVWNTVVDPDPESMITTSPTVVNNVVYVGVSSRVEFNGQHSPTFKGAVVALDAGTGNILWKTTTAPDGYTGNAVWGSSPAVVNGVVYVTTGNNYTAPAGVCLQPDQPDCTAPPDNDYTDSVLALDAATGAVKWSFKSLTSDVGTFDCDTCGPDADFGSAPNVYQTWINGQYTTVVGAGQKSGVYWALDAATGKPIWHTIVGPASDLGGIEWGSATDGQRIYVGIGNFDHQSYQITSYNGVTSTATAGSWAALDAATGKILWQIADPNGTLDEGFVSAANGVVYAGDTQRDRNNMFALNAQTGDILWQYASGGSMIGGAAIDAGSVYWGSGYPFGICAPGTSPCVNSDNLYAFAP